MQPFLLRRPRRNRKNEVIRDLVQENWISKNDLVLPLFVCEGTNQKIPIPSMPSIFRFSLDLLLEEIEHCTRLGIRAFAPFPQIPEEKKDPHATESYNPEGLYARTIRAIKQNFPNVMLFTDVALDPYNSDGHDGIVSNGEILNDETLEILGRMALVQAQAGSDCIAPSDMMDGRVGYLREVLDKNGFKNISILAYTAKYASAFYGPFRDALDSAPKFGDKKTYQMNPANAREALLEAQLDIAEGADIIMVKPALPYLDIIRLFRNNFTVPIAAYNVSGEYAMLKAAIQQGWLHEKVILESLISIKRAGADIILTYFAKEVASII